MTKICKLSYFICFICKCFLFVFGWIAFPFNKITRNYFKSKYYFILRTFFLYKRNNLTDSVVTNLKKIPVFVISFNNLFYLKQMICSLERYDLKNIHIIDNNSDYPPLIDYLKNIPYTVHYMKKNWGHKVLWESHNFDDIINNSLYVVTDPDIELSRNLSEDFLSELYVILLQHPYITKVGFALKLDDIPDSCISEKVHNWEKKYWYFRIYDSKYELYKADIDTTFALYRPGLLNNAVFYNAIRVAGDFTARHLPWYMNDEGQDYYKKTARTDIASWLSVQNKQTSTK